MRINPFVVIALIIVAGLTTLVLLSGKSYQGTGEAFMQALAKKDVKELARLSYLEKPERPLEEQWNECVNKRAKTYKFVWIWEGSFADTDDQAIMRITLIEFQGAEQKELETFELPLKKVDGAWKVDLSSLSRKFFPSLPR